MGNSADNADKDHRKVQLPVRERHQRKAQGSASETIDNCGGASEQEADDENPDHGHKRGFTPGIADQNIEHCEVRQPQLDAGNPDRDRDQAFDIAEDARKCCEQAEIGKLIVVGFHGLEIPSCVNRCLYKK